MKNNFWKHLTAAALAAMLLLALLTGFAAAEQEEDIFADWNKDAPALKTLIEFVEAVTDFYHQFVTPRYSVLISNSLSQAVGKPIKAQILTPAQADGMLLRSGRNGA